MQPNLNFLLRHPAHFIALGFGGGLAKKAPGTFGTLVGLPLFWLMLPLPVLVQWFIIGAFFIIGVPLCGVTGQHLGVSDHGSIVWDEIVAMLLILMFTPTHWIWWATAFLLFRLFDICKPFPIAQVDAKLKGGFGVMFDDILAAVYAIISLKIMVWGMQYVG